jgi:hypothetical protein
MSEKTKYGTYTLVGILIAVGIFLVYKATTKDDDKPAAGAAGTTPAAGAAGAAPAAGAAGTTNTPAPAPAATTPATPAPTAPATRVETTAVASVDALGRIVMK